MTMTTMMMMINGSAQTIPPSLRQRRQPTPQFTCALLALRWGETPQSLSDGRRTYFGSIAVIGSSEPDPEALGLGLRSERSPPPKRQSGESVIKSLVDWRYGRGVADLLIGAGGEAVYISSPESLPTIRPLGIPSVLGPPLTAETTLQHHYTDRTSYFLAAFELRPVPRPPTPPRSG